MKKNVKNRTMETRLIESNKLFNYRLIAEIAAKKIMMGERNNEKKVSDYIG